MITARCLTVLATLLGTGSLVSKAPAQTAAQTTPGTADQPADAVVTLVVLSACSGQARFEQFRAALEVELSGLGVPLVDESRTTGARTLRVTRCAFDVGQLELTLEGTAVTSKHQRRLDLADVPEPARARVAAIALAELVRTWPPALPGRDTGHAALQASSAPSAPSAPSLADPAPAATTSASAHASPSALRFAVGPRASVAFARRTLLYGGQGTLDIPLLPRLRLGLAASYQRADFTERIGTATLHAAGADLVLYFPLSEWLELGPYFGGGYLHAKAKSRLGLAEDPDTAWTAALGARLALSNALSERVSLLTCFGLGHTARGASFSAGDEPAFGIHGALLDLSFSVALAP